MATMTYPPYDNFHRSNSRHSMLRRSSTSVGYGPGGQQVAFPYSEPGLYNEPVDSYPQPSYQIYAPPQSKYMPGTAYDDLDIHDSYYPEERQLSTGPYSAVIPHAPLPRSRRHSSVSFSGHPSLGPVFDGFRRLGASHIKFKRKGALRSGITLAQAQANVRLSSSEDYTFHDLNTDKRGRLALKVRWPGYTSLTYEIPVDGYDGRVSLQTLARRVARACVHFLQTNMLPIPWDRVELHHLEEISIGVWQPNLRVREPMMSY